jgi:Zn-dependent protease with chaperone function
MDFFERQDKARHKTKLLVVYFILAVAAIVAACYFVGVIAFYATQAQHYRYDRPVPVFALWNPQLFLGVTVGVLAVIFIGSAYKTNQLSGGGGSLAMLMGGIPLNPNTTDPNERKLLNVVEEMAIASGVPVPEVYVLRNESSINAFAAGHTTSDAAIGVTRGCMELLSRDQLQGVIGHEFSHILNGDMRLNLRLIGIIFGLLCLATIGRILLRTRGRKNPLPLIGLALLLLGSIGVFFGRLIQAAVSRQREFLADASSVQFTRNPAGLSGALQKISRYSFGSKLESDHAPDLCHMFFSNGLGEPFFGLLATHPPIPDRIRAIDPAWDGTYPPLDKEQIEVVKRAAIAELERGPIPMPDLLTAVLGGVIVASGGAKTPPRAIRSHTVLPNLGNPTPLHLKYAEQLRESLPDSVTAATRNPADATALVYALLLSPDETTRATQLAGLAEHAAPAISEKAAALFPDVAATARRARLPMVNLALGALRQLSPAQFQQFSQTLQWLIESDQQVELFELVLQKILMHHLAPRFTGARPPVAQYYTLKPLVPDGALVLSALAHIGNSDPGAAEKAFETGAPHLRAPADVDYGLVPREQCGVDQLDAALGRLALAVPTIKKNLLEACAYTVGADGLMTESEAELLRAVADTLDCPIPPFVQTE